MSTTDSPRSFRGRVATRGVRHDAGRSRRKDVPLEQLAQVPRPEDRPDPVGILVAQDANRVQSLVPIRHGRMGATAFTFYRGAAAIMASDLSRTDSTDLHSQLCGDAHLSNFGLFNGPDRRLIFDVNDFDETLPGPFEWDLKRLAASVTIAARNNGISADRADRATRAAVKGYRKKIEEASQLAPLDLHYVRVEVDQIVADLKGRRRRQADKVTRKAKRKNSMRAFDKLSDVIDGRRQIVPDPPLIVRLPEIQDAQDMAAIRDFLTDYAQTLPHNRQELLGRYSIVDIASKVVGVGSVGTRCLIALMESGDGDPLILQFKEATRSVLEPYLGPSAFDQAGERVVQGQRLMQATGDIFLGWSRFDRDEENSYDFYFRQLWDGKSSLEVDRMGSKGLRHYARACGQTLALAHARSGDPAMIAGYLGDDSTADHALADFAAAYAELNESDYSAHQAAVADGRIPVIVDL